MSKASKRARESGVSSKVTDSIKKEDDARKAGLRPYETVEGRKWLMKALNPNDVAVSPTGIPSLHSHNISVLNWQGEYSIDVPPNIEANAPNYDSTMFLYQHPLIFGMSAARPAGTHDLREFGKFDVSVIIADNKTSYIIAPDASTVPASFTRCTQYLNNQINPSVFGGRTALSSRRRMFEQLTQRSRMIYGGATIIPTCSEDNNGGRITCCQQIFNPKKLPTGINPESDPSQMNATIYQFTESDFPDVSDTVQNPQMYYSRFQDGAYIPYKMFNPHQFEYVNSDEEITTQAPYFIENVSFLCGDVTNHPEPPGTQAPYQVWEKAGEFRRGADGINWTIQLKDGPLQGSWVLVGIRFYVMTYTGQRGILDLTGSQNSTNKTVVESDGRVDPRTNATVPTTYITGPNNEEIKLYKDWKAPTEGDNCLLADWVYDNRNHWWYPGTLWQVAANVLSENPTALTSINFRFSLPQMVLAADKCGLADYLNPYGWSFTSRDIVTDLIVTDPALKHPSICPYNGNFLTTIHISGASNTAPIKMILRYGCEILLVASSPYSPFKFMSPKYDESAIKTYARCIRSMRDAYFANAGSIPGQADYLNKLNTLIETDSADELNVLNQGGQWLGTVGV